MIEAPPSATRQRYELLRRLGQGGFGTVYEALDRSSGQRVALKELNAVTALNLTTFKHEFRAMQEVHHRNLVRLDGLFEERGKWLIAMELVEGTDLLDYVYEDTENGFDDVKLRDAFGQLANGIQALHTAGLVHRDVKPENVRVTRDGRVVLLDFGLATTIGQESGEARFNGAGTVSYMAPEQAERLSVGPPADWYAFGVCLYQALTGVLPIDGSTIAAKLLAKQTTHPPRASVQGFGVPEDLDELCDGLLKIDPTARPDGREVRRAFSASAQTLESQDGASLGPRARGTGVAFEGREQELQVLDAALTRSAEQAVPQLVLLEGDSGIGKSALVDRFVARSVCKRALRSRCYESELLPYKAFDGAMAELAARLCQLPAQECDALVPPRAALLSRLFPTLETVPSIAAAPLSGLAADPALQRLEAFSTFTRLLSKLSERDPLILVIDDLQWADAESFALLQALLGASGVRCLILATVRPRTELEGDALRGVTALRRLPNVSELSLRGLPREAAMAVVRRLMPAEVPEMWLVSIVDESHGHPLFLTVLTRFAGRQQAHVQPQISLELAISAHIGGLGRRARQLLDTVAIAGVPLPGALCGLAAGIPEAELASIAADLCRAKLLRRRQSGQIACYHDRIRVVAASSVDEARTRAIHAKLALTLASGGNLDPAQLARHYEASGALPLARDAYRRGAERALDALAFARAAALYARAIELSDALGAPQHEALSLRIARGHALARGGHSAEAANQYLAAAEQAAGAQQTQLRVWAAQHLLQGGHVAQGMAAAETLLRELGVPIPSSVPGRIAQIVLDRAVLRLRGLDVAQGQGPVDARQRMQLDALYGLALPISWLDAVKGSALGTRHLRLARASREPAHMARALADEAFFRVVGHVDNHDSPRLLQQARTLCDAIADPELDVVVSFREGIVTALRGETRRAIPKLEHAHRIATERCPGQPWLLTNVRVALGPLWLATGAHAQLAASTTAWLAEARERDDRFALALLEGAGSGYARHLMADDPDAGIAALQAALEPWPREPFAFAHFGALLATCFYALYRGGDAAYCWYERELPRLSSNYLLRSHFGKANYLAWEALACLCACAGQERSKVRGLLKQARAAAAALLTVASPTAQVMHALVAAQLYALELSPEHARPHVASAARLAEQHAHMLFHNVLRYLHGALLGAPGGAAEQQAAIAFFQAEGWKSPQRALRTFCPAIVALEGEA